MVGPEDRTPHVSVVIPVKDRRQLLTDALDALDAQTYADFEVIVVDDGSTDGSGEAAAGRTIGGRPVRVVDGGGLGAVHARQEGVAAARGDVLAFTDSDCVPDPRWLEHAVAALDAGADLVNGRTAPARPVLPLERSMGSGEEGLYPTCNVLYRRAAFDAAGGFDAGAGRRWGFRLDRRSRGDGFGEDTLLAWRVIRAGGAVRYEPDALVEHAVFPPDHRELVSRTARVAAFPAMVREIPELRRTLLTHGWQLGARTRVPVYLLLPMVLVGRPRLALACLVWWAALRLRELRPVPVPWRRKVQLLPVEMGIDALTAGALVAGSAKARSIVL
jgi:glycosyltransferase involved in cell wall biosynthesis